MFFNHVQAIGPGIAAMNDNGKLGLLRQRHLVAKDAVLHFVWRMIVEVIEPNFSPRDDFGILGQASQFIQMLLRHFLRFMRMNPDRGVNPIVLFGEGQGGI